MALEIIQEQPLSYTDNPNINNSYGDIMIIQQENGPTEETYDYCDICRRLVMYEEEALHDCDICDTTWCCGSCINTRTLYEPNHNSTVLLERVVLVCPYCYYRQFSGG